MPPPASKRLGLLRVLLPRLHRYRARRALLTAFSLLLIAAVPFSGLGNLDLWRGGHQVLGEPAGLGKALFFAFLFGVACYLVTFVVNAFGGRLFCGFGCPVAQANRLSEQVAARSGRPGAAAARARSWLFAALFAAAIVHWWIDRALWTDGSFRARAAALLACAALSAAIQLHARAWNWAFCRGWCPVGLYYSVVAPSKSFGIQFDPVAPCVECNACDHVCPAGIPPRDLLALVPRDEGLALARSPAVNHCLSCGDCVEACEYVVGRRGLSPIPLTFARAPSRAGHSAAPAR